jgi:hypothetical protein
LTNVLDANGGPREYHFLQDLNQRQDINNLLFGIYKNGAISYGSVGLSQEAAVLTVSKVSQQILLISTSTVTKGLVCTSSIRLCANTGDYRATSVLPFHRE